MPERRQCPPVIVLSLLVVFTAAPCYTFANSLRGGQSVRTFPQWSNVGERERLQVIDSRVCVIDFYRFAVFVSVFVRVVSRARIAERDGVIVTVNVLVGVFVRLVLHLCLATVFRARRKVRQVTFAV